MSVTPASDRLGQVGLVVSTVALGWLLMQALHELGHVLHAVASGAVVERVELHPLAFSRTVLGVNPHPRFVAWGGALWGCALPLLTAALARALTSAQLAGVASLVVFGLIAAAGGLALWHGVGSAFRAPIDRRLAFGVGGAAATIAALELALTQTM